MKLEFRLDDGAKLNGNDYCQIIENEVSSRTDAATDIVWRNAESSRVFYC